ncbi:MAG: TolC family protein [Spirochaetaceae bacterium]|nr:TolC family protein [Spirochaetaceae bacterium]
MLKRRYRLKPGAAGAIFLFVFLSSSCVTPDPIAVEEHRSSLVEELERMEKRQKLPQEPMSIAEVSAMVLKYNLDHRVRLMEEALAAGELEIARLERLPSLASNAGYTAVSDVQSTGSENLQTGVESEPNSVSQDQGLYTGDLSVAWNVLDFGVSFYQARQQANRVLILRERRRKAIHTLLQEVRAAYWRAVGAQELQQRVLQTIAEVETILEQIEKARDEGLQPPLQNLMRQKTILRTKAQLQAILRNLQLARPKLAGLMNLPPGKSFELQGAELFEGKVPELRSDPSELEEIALGNRPELRQARYEERNAGLEVRTALARLFPGLELNTSYQYTSNSYAAHSNWGEAGIRLSWNLMNLVSAPKRIRQLKMRRELQHQRGLALAMAVVSQVHIGYHRFETAREKYLQALRRWEIERSILRHITDRAESDTASRVEALCAAADALKAEMEVYNAYAGMEMSLGMLYTSLGLDPIALGETGVDVDELSQQITQSFVVWRRGSFRANGDSNGS